VAVETDIDEIHRLTAEEYHRLIEAGGLNEDTRVELIDRAAPRPRADRGRRRARRG